MDGLLVGDGDDREKAGNRERDGDGEMGGRRAREHEDKQDLLGRVGHGGERVGGEHGEGHGLREPLVPRLGRRRDGTNRADPRVC